jgi:hypothetical protein
MRSRRTIRTTLALAILLASPAVRAQAPSVDEQRARADALFREGQQLVTAGQIATGCAKLEESQRLDPKLGRLLNLAYCHEQLGRTATAWSEYNQAAAMALQTGQKEREAFARKQANELARKLSFFQIDATKQPDLSIVTIDGRALTHDQWAVPFAVDPGAHKLTFTAPGRKTGTKEVTASAAGTTRVSVEALEPGTPDATPPPSTTATPDASNATPNATSTSNTTSTPTPTSTSTSTAPSEETPTSSGGGRTLGWIIGGAGIVGIGVGTVFGVRAMSLKSDADQQCPNKKCTPTGTSLISDAKTSAVVADIGFAVGAVGLAVGAWLVLRPSSSGAASAQLAPIVARDRAGLSLQGAW